MSLIDKLSISCAAAADLIGKSYGEGLLWHETIRLRYHTSMCEICMRYKKQQHLIHLAIKLHKETIINYQKQHDLKDKIVDQIKKH